MKSIASVLFFLMVFCLLLVPTGFAAEDAKKPNVVIIFADDFGYGDLGCYGHPTIATPNLDQMALEGQRWTTFYTAASVCTPSRAGLLTGRLPIRNGMCSIKRHVMYPNSGGGLPKDEVTLAESLKDAGYRTACVGKWHLGHLPQHLPMKHGFDEYYGLPYSNDMARFPDAPNSARGTRPKSEHFNVPLIRGEKVIEQPAHQPTLTKRYTEEAIEFIEKNKDRPFFLYMAHTMPHVPLFRSEEFEGKSLRGLFGDVIEEVDDSVGQVLDTLRRLKLNKNTLVVFTTDNGPWLICGPQGGSAGLLRSGKGSTFEGGMRVPGIFWWPETIKPAVIREMGSTLDLFPTVATICGAKVPTDRTMDGVDLTPVLLGTGSSSRDTMFYYRGDLLCAVRKGPYKMFFRTQPSYGNRKGIVHDPPLLYHIEHDPSEKYNIAKRHPKVIEQLKKIAEEHQKGVNRVPSQLDIVIPKDGKNKNKK